MSKNEVNIPLDKLQQLIISAVRYSLGRRTYIVSVTCSLVKAYWQNLNEATKQIIIRDIKEQKDRKNLGAECDKKDWENILQLYKVCEVRND